MRRFRAEKQRAQVTSAHCTGSAPTRRDRVVIRRSAGIIMLGTCPRFPPPPRTPATARPRWPNATARCGRAASRWRRRCRQDAMVQSMPDASPAKWHLAHTTWFFERFVLGARDGYAPVDPQWDYLFNSYYNSVGPMHARPRPGLVSRPSLIEVLESREKVDARMELGREW